MTAATAAPGSDLAFYLKRLRLPRLGEHLSSITQRAAAEGWSYEEFLTTGDGTAKHRLHSVQFCGQRIAYI